ncbi:MAG: RecX family transcriptional regulator [Bacteroidales bacterium]|nr:RecX family transcriptional regulator [Bacteroidales bacterium]
MPKNPAKPLTPDQALDKMAKYCAYQERCMKDVTDKLKTFDITQEAKDEILDYLLDNRFVNDERFARSFVRGKVNQSGWGLNKIRFHLMQKGIDKDIIDEALEQTDEETYRQRLIDVLKLKAKSVKAETEFEKKRKLAAYAMQKGFEAGLVWKVLREFQVAQNENK